MGETRTAVSQRRKRAVGSPSLSARKLLVENLYISMFSTNNFRAEREGDPNALFLLYHTTVRVSPLGTPTSDVTFLGFPEGLIKDSNF